jgi:hypothetical protein
VGGSGRSNPSRHRPSQIPSPRHGASRVAPPTQPGRPARMVVAGSLPLSSPPPPSSPFFSWLWALLDGHRRCLHILQTSFGDGIPSSMSIGRWRSPRHWAVLCGRRRCLQSWHCATVDGVAVPPLALLRWGRSLLGGWWRCQTRCVLASLFCVVCDTSVREASWLDPLVASLDVRC